MRRLVVLVGLASCTQVQVRKAHTAGEIATGAGLVGLLVATAAAELAPAHEDSIMHTGLVFVPVTVLGALLYVTTEPSESNRPTTVTTRRERARAAAWDLTKQAAEAARAADCRQVQAIEPRVRDLDSDFHASVFLRDVAIRRCL